MPKNLVGNKSSEMSTETCIEITTDDDTDEVENIDKIRCNQESPRCLNQNKEKVFVGLDNSPADFYLITRLLGPSGQNLEFIQIQTKARVDLHGKGSLHPSAEPLHFLVRHDSYDGLQEAVLLVQHLVDTVQNDFEEYCAEKQNNESLVTSPWMAIADHNTSSEVLTRLPLETDTLPSENSLIQKEQECDIIEILDDDDDDDDNKATQNCIHSEKVYVGSGDVPLDLDLLNRLLGPSGSNIEYLQMQTNAEVELRGNDSMNQGLDREPLHFFVRHSSVKGLQKAVQLIQDFIRPICQNFQQVWTERQLKADMYLSVPVSPWPIMYSQPTPMAEHISVPTPLSEHAPKPIPTLISARDPGVPSSISECAMMVIPSATSECDPMPIPSPISVCEPMPIPTRISAREPKLPTVPPLVCFRPPPGITGFTSIVETTTVTTVIQQRASPPHLGGSENGQEANESSEKLAFKLTDAIQDSIKDLKKETQLQIQNVSSTRFRNRLLKIVFLSDEILLAKDLTSQHSQLSTLVNCLRTLTFSKNLNKIKPIYIKLKKALTNLLPYFDHQFENREGNKQFQHPLVKDELTVRLNEKQEDLTDDQTEDGCVSSSVTQKNSETLKSTHLPMFDVNPDMSRVEEKSKLLPSANRQDSVGSKRNCLMQIGRQNGSRNGKLKKKPKRKCKLQTTKFNTKKSRIQRSNFEPWFDYSLYKFRKPFGEKLHSTQLANNLNLVKPKPINVLDLFSSYISSKEKSKKLSLPKKNYIKNPVQVSGVPGKGAKTQVIQSSNPQTTTVTSKQCGVLNKILPKTSLKCQIGQKPSTQVENKSPKVDINHQNKTSLVTSKQGGVLRTNLPETSLKSRMDKKILAQEENKSSKMDVNHQTETPVETSKQCGELSKSIPKTSLKCQIDTKTLTREENKSPKVNVNQNNKTSVIQKDKSTKLTGSQKKRINQLVKSGLPRCEARMQVVSNKKKIIKLSIPQKKVQDTTFSRKEAQIQIGQGSNLQMSSETLQQCSMTRKNPPKTGNKPKFKIDHQHLRKLKDNSKNQMVDKPYFQESYRDLSYSQRKYFDLPEDLQMDDPYQINDTEMFSNSAQYLDRKRQHGNAYYDIKPSRRRVNSTGSSRHYFQENSSCNEQNSIDFYNGPRDHESPLQYMEGDVRPEFSLHNIPNDYDRDESFPGYHRRPNTESRYTTSTLNPDNEVARLNMNLSLVSEFFRV